MLIEILSAVSLGLIAYISTNVDNLVLLMTFRADSSFGNQQLLLGYFSGTIALLILMIAFSITRSLIPSQSLDLLGLAPLAMGFKKLFDLFLKKDRTANKPRPASKGGWQFLTLTTVLIANSGDTITVFAPLLMESKIPVMIILCLTFLLMAIAWYLAGSRMLKHPGTADFLQRYGHYIVPFAMMAIGLYILNNTSTDLI